MDPTDWKTPDDKNTQLIKKTIAQIKRNKEIMVCKADKGNMTVIMEEEYTTKVKNMINSFPYKKLDRNPNSNFEKVLKTSLNQLMKSKKISKNTHPYLNPYQSICPRFYSSPKIHKNGYSLRPIVDYRKSPSYATAPFFNQLSSPITRKSKFVTKNSSSLAEELRKIIVKRSYILVLFDVISLFTKVPTNTTLTYMHEKLTDIEDWTSKTKLKLEDIIMLTERCMDGNYFEFNGSFYQQLEGSPMGSPLSPVFAEFFMQKLEEYLVPSQSSVLSFEDDMLMTFFAN